MSKKYMGDEDLEESAIRGLMKLGRSREEAVEEVRENQKRILENDCYSWNDSYD